MQINAVLTPMPYPINMGEVNVSLSSYVIGDSSSYTFSVVTSEPLTSNPAIIIDFPT
jgi:hypothetical protein